MKGRPLRVIKQLGVIRATAVATRIRHTAIVHALVLLGLLVGFSAARTPDTGPGSHNIRFAVIGDSGTGKQGQWELAKTMEAFYHRQPYEIVLMLGDNIYGGGNRKSLRLCFEKPYEKLLDSGVEFYASLGNHGSALAE